jgi:hypothetical protein
MEREWAALITLFGFGGFLAAGGFLGIYLLKREEKQKSRSTPPSHP